MCQAIAQGGQRCAAHTRPRYQSAPFGTPEWDEAAAAYASTPTGRVELASSLAAAEAAEDIRSAVAFEHALTEGQRLREKASLFREELAALDGEAPQPDDDPAPPTSVFSEGHDDSDDWVDERERIGGYEYTDEEEWETSPDLGWSPPMTHARWDAADPVFAGCTTSMTSNQFIDQVCDNTGITRAEFEAAAALYMNRTGIPLLAVNDAPGFGVGLLGRSSMGLEPIDTERVRFLLVDHAAPGYTPQQIRDIAALAREQRDRREAAAAASTDSASSRGRWQRVEVPADPAELTRLAGSDDAAVRAAVAAHANTPADVLARMATGDSKVEVRAEAARNANLPQATLLGLASDRSVKVRANAARNPNMPSAELETLAADPNDSVKGAVARNPATPPALYMALASHASATVRKHAARRREIPANVAGMLAADTDQQVRGALAKNRATPATVLATLATDDAQSVRAYAARNANMSPALLRGRLSRDPAPGVRAAVGRNENTSLAVLTRLSSDRDPWVRRNVAWNPATPAPLLYVLGRDPDDAVSGAARDRNISTEPAAS